ncbi:hypothetical protein quinque_000587 [Culex quinquefasciatus]
MQSVDYTVEALASSPISQLGEGPIWDEGTQSLYYVDIHEGSIHRYDYQQGKTFSATIDHLPPPISFVFLVEGRPDQFVLGTGDSLSLISWDGRSAKGTFVQKVAALGQRSVRFNDGKVDQRELGDVFRQAKGTLYRFEGRIGGSFYEQKHGIAISNGITWDASGGKFYYVDSSALDVKEFNVDGEGNLADERVLIDFSVQGGRNPGYVGDGMTSDLDGNLYVACWCGSRVLKIDVRAARIVKEIWLPVPQITSVAFGGPQLDELFVTTAATNMYSSSKIEGLDHKQPPGSGALFRMADLKVEQLPGPLAVLGEGPTWDADTQSLYYVDIMGSAILRYDRAENKTYRATIDGLSDISMIIQVRNKSDQFVLGTRNTLSLVSWDGRTEKASFVKTAGDLGESQKHVRFNDGKVDPQGRLYAGTMRLETLGDIFDQKEGKFYRFEGKVGGEFYEQKRDISVSNGLTWDEQTGKFYYIDSAALDVKQFDVDEGGNLQNETVLYDIRVDGKNPGFVCDGMTSDAEGNLYVATWGGSKLLKINPKTKQLVQEIPIPAKQVTSASFGGPQLDELYVTTAHTNNQDAPAGALFKVTGLGVKGKEMYKMVLKD